jgi:hypothetical protein
MWPQYYKLIEPNSATLVKSLYERGHKGKTAVEFYPWLRQVRLHNFIFHDSIFRYLSLTF